MKKRKKIGCLAAGAWLLGFLVITIGGCSHPDKHDAPEQVVLLHGLGRKGKAMFLLQKRMPQTNHAIQQTNFNDPCTSTIFLFFKYARIVIRSSGAIGGYRGGITRKKALLGWETVKSGLAAGI